MELFQSTIFDEEDRDSGLRTIKKRRTSQKEEEDNDDEEMGDVGSARRNLFVSPSPIKEVKRSKPHTNFNPFAWEPPSLLSVSSGDVSPESNLSASKTYAGPILREDLLSSPSANSQNQLCKEFKKTLSFVEFIEDEAITPINNFEGDLDQSLITSPSTPPSSSLIPAQFPKTVSKSLRFHHRPHAGDNPTSRFDDEFETLGRLGGGSFGTVFKVRKRLDGCMYAVKVVKQAFLGKSGRERVLKEVYALAALVNNSDNHHVVRYFSSWIDVDDRLYIQTELCDMSLEDLLKLRNHQSPKGSDLEDVACEILRQLLAGLRGLHSSNVVHLDIKPANILVKNGTYKLGDLGHVAMARFVRPELPTPPPLRATSATTSISNRTLHLDEEDERQINAAFSVVQDVDEGDVRYMPRELLSENHDHLPKADIFSLAASVYEMFLEKALPANGEEWASLRDGHLAAEATSRMSTNFKQLIHLMIHPDPAKRPTADALLLTGGPGGILLGQEQLGRDQLKREIELLRGLHPAHAVLRRANTM